MNDLSDPTDLPASRGRTHNFPSSNLMLSAVSIPGKHQRPFRSSHGRAFPAGSAAVITNCQAPDKSADAATSRTR